MIEYKIRRAANVKGVHPTKLNEDDRLYLEVEFYRDGALIHVEDFEIGRAENVRRYTGKIGPDDEILEPTAYEIVRYPIADEIENLVKRWIITNAETKLRGETTDGIDHEKQAKAKDAEDPKGFVADVQPLVGVKYDGTPKGSKKT